LRVAFATCAALPDGWHDDAPAAALLGAQPAIWNDPQVDWAAYDRVVIRSTWDYTNHLDDFLAWCQTLGRERLRNRPDLVAFNADKRYLAELAVDTVPTLFVAPGDPLPALEGELVVKPNVSAGARDTGRFGPATHQLAAALIAAIGASGRTALVQPYIATVDRRGETAFVFLGGELSHVLRKRAVLAPDEVAPLADVEHGPALAMLADDLVAPTSAEPAELAFAERVMAEVVASFGMPLYARVDIVSDERGRPALLELEAIEPTLYLAHAPGAVERLAAAVLAS
jgi:hypothetical protein